MDGKTVCTLILALILCACNTATGPRLAVEQAWTHQAKVSEISAGDLNQTCICERVTATNTYLRITNRGSTADRLMRVETDSAVRVELRQTAITEALTSPTILDGVDIPARGKVDFAQGGYVMVLKDLRGDLKPGDQVRLILFFEKTGKVEVQTEVR